MNRISEVNILIKTLEDMDEPSTITEIQNKMNNQFSNLRISEWLRELVKEGVVIRTEDSKKAYFRLKDVAEDELTTKIQEAALNADESLKSADRWEASSFMNQIQNEMNTYEKNAIKCPNCKATNTKKISAVGRAASIGFFGILSSSIGKTYKCNKCGYKW